VSPLISFGMATLQPPVYGHSHQNNISRTIDPVCVSTSSHTVFEYDALSAFITKLSLTRQCSPLTRARRRGSCKTDTRFVSLRAMQMQMGHPASGGLHSRHAGCGAPCVLLVQGYTPQGRAYNARRDAGIGCRGCCRRHYCVRGSTRGHDGLCSVARTKGILFRVAAAS
jgi:hypothetical protein